MKINTSLQNGDATSALTTNQLNLSIPNRPGNRRRPPRKVARDRAAYWFDRMRKVVNAAREWQPAPMARPQQTYINLQPTNS